MTGLSRSRLIISMMGVVLILSAMWTVPVLADDGAPPPTDTPMSEETLPTPPAVDPTAEPIIDSTPVETAVPTAEPLMDVVPAATQETVADSSTAQESTSLPEVLEQLPEGTTVVVTDSNGAPLPLASQQAAQVVTNNDPMWCPVGVKPGGAGCTTPGQTSFRDMLTELSAMNSGTGPSKAGVIWIAGDYKSGTDDPGIINTNFTFDGLTLTSMAKYALTIQGGWTGSSTIVDQFNPSEFNASLNIVNWLAPVTLNDILITGASVNPHVGDQPALLVQTTKSIVLNRVQVVDNTLPGAVLDNGLAPIAVSPITITDSIFNKNQGDGLHVYSIGAITIRNLTANFNGVDDGFLDYGVFLTNWLSYNAHQPVTLNGTNQFKGNLGTGLFISSFGNVTLNNITAYANDDGTNDVAHDGGVDGGDGSGVIVDVSASIKMTGTNLINHNQLNGLDFSSDGAISVSNLTASNNGYAGAVINNCLKSGAVCSIVGKPVTLTGTNIFNENGYEGLDVFTDGVISISNVTASGNASFGVYLDNCAYDGVTLFACTNTLPYAVSIQTPSTFLSNTNDGLYIHTTGAVTLKGITASFNQSVGVNIDNRGILSKPQNVTLSGTNTFNGNDNTGLQIQSYGAVVLSNVTANDNNTAGYGVFVDNRGYNVSVLASVLPVRKPVTFLGTNIFNNNFSGGAFIYSVGDVTLSNFTALGNGLTPAGDGVHIENQFAWYPNGLTESFYAANVTLNGFGIFEGNGDEGLQIFSKGAIKLNNVTANGNADVGLWASNGSIATINIRQPITLLGINTFNNNNGGGTMLYSFGAVTLGNVTAIGNLPTGATGNGHGVYIQNDQAWSPKGVLTSYAANVTISGFGYFDGNAGDGLLIFSKGAVTLSNTTANHNSGNGTSIVNTGDLLPQKVTLTGVNNFNGNGTTAANFGLQVTTDGMITISNLTASDNLGSGAWLDNLTDAKPNKFLGVTLSGVSSFQGNQGVGGNGLYIATDGSAIMTNITADGNIHNGVTVIATKNITLTCGNAFSNVGTGFDLQSGAAMTIKGLHADSNGINEDITAGVIPITRTWGCP